MKRNYKKIFDKITKLEPEDYEEWAIYDTETFGEAVEAHLCEETNWHYLFFPNRDKGKYYILIDREEINCDTLAELKQFAMDRYFE